MSFILRYVLLKYELQGSGLVASPPPKVFSTDELYGLEVFECISSNDDLGLSDSSILMTWDLQSWDVSLMFARTYQLISGITIAKLFLTW